MYLGAVKFTYERYESSSVEKAIKILNQRGPVTQNYYYVEVMTPKGWVGRDIDGTLQRVGPVDKGTVPGSLLRKQLGRRQNWALEKPE